MLLILQLKVSCRRLNLEVKFLLSDLPEILPFLLFGQGDFAFSSCHSVFVIINLFVFVLGY